MTYKIAIAASGSGRSLENLIKVSKNLNFEISAVILSRADCKAFDIATKNDIPYYLDKFPLKSEAKLSSFLEETATELIVLAGFLKPFPVLQSFENKVLNIHPALLPNYGGKGMYGMNIHNKVFENKEKFSGATIHLVNEEYDKGRILSQLKVNIESLTSADEIAGKVFEFEKILLPFTISKFLNDKNYTNLELTEKEMKSWQLKKL